MKTSAMIVVAVLFVLVRTLVSRADTPIPEARSSLTQTVFTQNSR